MLAVFLFALEERISGFVTYFDFVCVRKKVTFLFVEDEMKIKIGLLGLALMGFASVASAGRVWVDDVIIDEVGVFTEKSSGTYYQVIYVKSESLKQSQVLCSPTQSHGIVSVMSTGDFSSVHQARYSTLLSAHAQGLKVDLLINDSDCSTSALYDKDGAPNGRGATLVGVVISP